MGLYAAKAGIVGRLSPLVDGLAVRGVSPDAITLAAVPVALVGGACIVASSIAQRRYFGPLLVSGPRRSFSPDWITRGQRPE